MGKENQSQKGKISGQISLSDEWESEVYLSFIEDFNSMYYMSNSMIIQKEKIDQNGHFSFDLSFLPESDHLFRLHFVKKGSPSASIIIGGKEENHLFLIANRTSNIQLLKPETESAITDILVANSTINNAFQQILNMDRQIDTMSFNESTIKREFVKKAIHEKYRFIADTSSHFLISLFAVYKSKFESNYKLHEQFYQSYLDKWTKDQSSYFKVFRQQIPARKSHENLFRILIGALAIIIGILIGRFISKNPKTKNDPLKLLSIQERKIFNLLRQGITNQEISDECNIGLSTVKSHVSNIYAKLKIKSRKEAMNIEL